jgi:hypothetical protein
LPGSNPSICFHWSSRSCFRIAPPTYSTGWARILISNVNTP